MITNPIFTERERTLLEFVLGADFPERDRVLRVLERIREPELTRDVTPYYWILEFRPGGTAPGYGPLELYLSLAVGSIPTVFLVYGRDGEPFELEIFNADSSAMDLDAIPEGPVTVHEPK